MLTTCKSGISDPILSSIFTAANLLALYEEKLEDIAGTCIDPALTLRNTDCGLRFGRNECARLYVPFTLTCFTFSK